MVAEIEPVARVDAQLVDSRSLVILPFTEDTQSAQNGTSLRAETVYGQVVRYLTAIPGLYLTDPATASVYSDSELPPDVIAGQLGVRGLVRGQIVQIEDGVRFELDFFDTSTNDSSLSRTLERPTGEIALLQTDIATTVVDALASASRLH